MADLEERIHREYAQDDLANVGASPLAAIERNAEHPALKDWRPADNPAEVVVYLLNTLDDQGLSQKGADNG